MTGQLNSEHAPKEANARVPGPRKAGRRVVIGLAAVGVCAALLVAGVLIGYSVATRRATPSPETDWPEPAATMWTCSMHPQIKLPKPGKCPICFMDLIPLTDESGGDGGPRQLKMSEAAMALADIQTTPVERQVVTNLVRMVGKVDYDETRLAEITAWLPRGRLDRLYVDYTGTTVRKGDHLVYIYSPELVVTQRALLENWEAYNRLDTRQDKERVLIHLRSSEDRLRLWGLNDRQIEEIKQRGNPSDHMTIYAPVGGIVIEKHVNEGDWVENGAKIYTIADLSQVWVFLDAYESDIPWIRYGQQVEFATETYPGEVFKGRIAFIDPVLSEKTRTVKVRVNVPNTELRLKPGMFVHAIVRSQLAAGGRVIDGWLAGKWICPMHPEIVKDGPGKCDVCEMDLVPAEQLGFVAPSEVPEPPLVIPATAPLITGKRAIVYVKLPDRQQPTFEGREVLLGYRAGDLYIVRYGLKEGEQVVTKGNFKIDSALQLLPGKLSMMTPELEGVAQADQQREHPREKIATSSAFRAALVPVYESYLATAEALADDDLAAARKAVNKIPDLVAAADAESLYADARQRWQQTTDRLLFAAYETIDASDRVTIRRQFSHLSRAFIALVQAFGNPLPEPVVQIHCPMAFNNQGADWLQRAAEVRNPYFGHQMLRCGQVQARFASQVPLVMPEAFRQQLTPVYASYLNLQTALADDRLDDAKIAWQAMRKALAGVRAHSLDERTGEAWQTTWRTLTDALTPDLGQANIEDLRKAFEALAAGMLAMVDAFGHLQKEPLYEAYCPMAFSNKGASWLQAGDTVDNPYFGHKMRRCGEIKRRFAASLATAIKANSLREDRP